MHISGGTSVYERRCKTGDFEHKHFSQTFNFSLQEGEDYDTESLRVGVLAVTTVHRMLGLKLDPAQTIEIARTAVVHTPIVSEGPAPAPAVEAPAKAKRSVGKLKAAATTAPEDNQPLPLGEELPGLGDTSTPSKGKPSAEPELPVGDPMAELLGIPTAEPEIDDRTLTTKVQRKVGEWGDNREGARAVGVIVRKYAMTAIAIPQEQRNQFLRELEAFKPVK